ncbi:MAG TPA: hypothetical protein VGP36_21915 [Mycobacteriales bacterium]|nr:hypothetical protein [Mycobacteriales bacterium]
MRRALARAAVLACLAGGLSGARSATGTGADGGGSDTRLRAAIDQDAAPQGWVFVPGYDGRRPYGTWSARALVAPRDWVGSGRTRDDVGYAVVAPRAGKRLTDVVGSMPVAFDAPRGAYVWAFGYPAAAPGGDRRALYCRGTVRPDPYRSGSQGLACSMTRGARRRPLGHPGTRRPARGRVRGDQLHLPRQARRGLGALPRRHREGAVLLDAAPVRGLAG